MHFDVEEALGPRAEAQVPARVGRWRRPPWSHHPRSVAVPALLGVVALACGAMIWWAASGGSHPATSSSSTTAAQIEGASTVRQATTKVTAAGTSMSLGMSNLHSLPTVATVSGVVDPYLVALQRYDQVLTGAALTPGAARWRTSVLEHVHQIETDLSSLSATPSGLLGNWIQGFYLQTAELQSSIEGLQTALGPPA